MVKKFWKSPWTIAIVSAFLAPVATMIVDAIMKKPLLSTLWSVIKTIWSWIIAFLTLDLKMWWVLLFIGVVVEILIIIAKISDAKQEDSNPEFVSYKEDYFGGWKWTWNWHFNKYDMKWHIDDDSVVAHCPKCDTPMFHDRHDTAFECPRCRFKTDYRSKHTTRQEVKVLIIDNIERKNKQNSGN